MDELRLSYVHVCMPCYKTESLEEYEFVFTHKFQGQYASASMGKYGEFFKWNGKTWGFPFSFVLACALHVSNG
jgi:hypothetical protein